MIDILKIFAALALGYLLGSLNTSVIVGRIYGKDITRHGSKSAGLTNTLRVLGKPAAAFVLAAGAGAVLGHNWPLYFGFKGGKGMLTAAAVMFMIAWPAALICLGAFL